MCTSGRQPILVVGDRPGEELRRQGGVHQVIPMEFFETCRREHLGARWLTRIHAGGLLRNTIVNTRYLERASCIPVMLTRPHPFACDEIARSA